jgi:hypothetical protein
LLDLGGFACVNPSKWLNVLLLFSVSSFAR